MLDFFLAILQAMKKNEAGIMKKYSAKIKKESQLSTQFFIGCLISSELRTHLHNSQKYKEEHLFGSFEDSALQRIKHHEKEFLGFPLRMKKVELALIHLKEKAIKEKLGLYFPDYPISKAVIYIFPQILIN